MLKLFHASLDRIPCLFVQQHSVSSKLKTCNYGTRVSFDSNHSVSLISRNDKKERKLITSQTCFRRRPS